VNILFQSLAKLITSIEHCGQVRIGHGVALVSNLCDGAPELEGMVFHPVLLRRQPMLTGASRASNFLSTRRHEMPVRAPSDSAAWWFILHASRCTAPVALKDSVA
jgi:hypothetical protein